jgi:hypothetical protein
VADAATARQPLSIAPDDQQRVVDACSEPEHDPSVGAKLGKSSTLHEKTEQRVAKAEALAVRDDAMLFLRGGSTLFRTTS